MDVSNARRLKQFADENAKLRKVFADLSLVKAVQLDVKDVVQSLENTCKQVS